MERSAVQRSLLGNVFRQRGLKGVDLWTTAESAKSEAFFDAGSTLDQVLSWTWLRTPELKDLGSRSRLGLYWKLPITAPGFFRERDLFS